MNNKPFNVTSIPLQETKWQSNSWQIPWTRQTQNQKGPQIILAVLESF